MRFIPSSRLAGKTLSSFVKSGIRRKLVCLVLILSLLSLPIHGTSFHHLKAFAANSLPVGLLPVNSFSSLWKWLFAPSRPQRPARLSLTERLARVAALRVSPARFVGYQGQKISFSALPLDSAGQTVQGVRLSWLSSDAEKLTINDGGEATLSQPGLVTITCRAGAVEKSVPVLIRAGQRPPQTDEEWEADQSALTEASGTVGALTETTEIDPATDIADGNSGEETMAEPAGPAARGESGRKSPSFFASVLDRLVPTAAAQNNSCGTILGDNSDSGVDALYTDASNLTGNPPHRALEPFSLGSVNPEGSNFQMAVPLYGLGGRGLQLGTTLYYNSRVWTKNGSNIIFNAVNGWPFAGFSIGYGRLFTYGSGASTKYVWVAPDGTRHYLGTGSDTTSATYLTTDGTHITFVGSKSAGGYLYFNDGTRVTISATNNRLLPTRIRDANGNYISITYKTYQASGVGAFLWRQAIQYIFDTRGRVIEFVYDDTTDNLTEIQVPAFGSGNRTLVKFKYACQSVSNSFSGLTVQNRPTTTVPALTHVYYPDTGTGLKFVYSAYGMIYQVTGRKGMTIDGNGEITDGTEKSKVEFDYPTTASSLTDAPAFTEREESATSAPTSTFTYASGTGSGTKTFTITRPDGSKLLLTRATSGGNDGYLTETQVQTSGSVTMAKTEIAYTTDGGGNRQVQSVTSYNDDNVPVKVDFDYDSYGNVTNRRDYGFKISGNWQVRRRTRMVYETGSSYLNAYLRRLVTEANVYDGLENTSDGDDVMLTKTTFAYDNYAAMGGMEAYTGQAHAPQHESAYDTTLTTRGNLTGTTRYKDVGAGTSITRLKKYDIYGSVIKEQLGCCNERVYLLNGTNAYDDPVEVTSGASGTTLTEEMEDDFNTGLVEVSTDAREEETTYTYDAALRPDTVGYPGGATADFTYNDSSLTASRALTYDEGGSSLTLTTSTTCDGYGRVISASAPGLSAVTTTYDAMGRVWKRNTPSTPQTVNTFDALGRVTLVTQPGGATIQTAYDGAAVTVTDQVNRQIKREADGLGRLIKVYEQDVTNGNLTQETSYTYSLLDNLTEVNQGGQLRKFKYDSLSRLLFESIPEMRATISDGAGGYWTTKYTYTDYDAVETKTDARGVIATYSYDNLFRYIGVSYNTSGAAGVATTPSVSYSYATSGANIGRLSSVTVSGQSSESYSYDSGTFLLSGISRTVGARTYATSYLRNEAGQLTRLTYPSTRAVNMNHDSYGRVSSLVNNSDSSNYLSSISYNGAGLVTSQNIGGNGGTITETFTYDSNRLQLTSQTVVQNGSFTRLSLNYDYDAASGESGYGTTAGNSGQLMGVVNTSSIGGQTESAAYSYDNLGRLVTSAQTTNGVSAQRRFAYDRWGNRTGAWDATSGGTQLQTLGLE